MGPVRITEADSFFFERQKLPLLAQIPLIQSVRESGDAGRPVSAKTDAASEYYDLLANNIVRELP